MTEFDPTKFQEVVSHFPPVVAAPFQALLPAKDMIAELRSKGASFTLIAELLTQHSLPVSRSHIARFCHQVLGERISRRRTPKSRSNSGALSGIPISPFPIPTSSTVEPDSAQDQTSPTPTVRSKGPRIAQIRPATPDQP